MRFGVLKRIVPTWKNTLLAVLASALLILAFPDFEYWLLAWFALVPLMWAVGRETKLRKPARSKGVSHAIDSSIIRSFVLGWIFGTIFFFGTCWWLTYAPINYAAFPPVLAYFLLFCVTAVAGLFPGIFATILSVLIRWFGSWAFLAAPFVWVFTEFARYWLTGNNWNAIGYSQAFTWLSDHSLLTAQVGGVYLVGFGILTFNVLLTSGFLTRQELREKEQRGERIADSKPDDFVIIDLSHGIGEPDTKPIISDPHPALWLSTTAYLSPIFGLMFLFANVLHDYGKELEGLKIKNLRTLLVLLLLPTGFSAFIWAMTTTPNLSYGRFVTGETVVTAVQPNVPMSGIETSELERLRNRQIHLSQSAFEENLARYKTNDLGIIDNIDDEQYADIYREISAKKPKIVILPESPMNFMYSDDREFQKFINDFARENNVSVLFNSAEPDKGTTMYFNSAVMVGPDGKQVDQYDKIYLLPFGEAVPSFLEGIVPGFVGNFAYGREYDLFPVGDAKAGVMICFESHFGQLSREYVKNGADVIIEMTNDGYLGPTPILRQHLANAVFRAVETNRPVLRVTNVGITAYITEKGEVLDATTPYQEDTRVWSVSKSDGSQTFYVKYGDWFAWLCSLITFILLIFTIRGKRAETRL